MIVICAISLFIHKEQYACSVIFICAEGASQPLCTNLPPIGSSRGQPQIWYQGHVSRQRRIKCASQSGLRWVDTPPRPASTGKPRSPGTRRTQVAQHISTAR